MVDTDEEIKWHNDGHVVSLLLNKDKLEIVDVYCPNRGKEDSPCAHDDVECVVEHVLKLYGLECQVGVIPTEDEAFSAWISTQQ